MPQNHLHRRPNHLDMIYQMAQDSWWVYRHALDPQGSPLPYGRIVYYADSEQDAQRWIDTQPRVRPSF